MAFERAYLANTRLAMGRTLYSIDVSIHGGSSRPRGRGFLVRFRVSSRSLQQEAEPTGTPPHTFVSGVDYRVGYFVSDRLVMRDESATNDSPDPIEFGELVQCAE